MKIKGAEATVEIKNGKVVKIREEKKYRHEKLDEKIRKQRTSTELKMIEDASLHGVKVPESEKTNDSTIKMEKIDGQAVKKIIEGKPEIMDKYGENIALLHSTDIIHGDLTTSNALLSDEKEVYIIDFGLAFRSQRIEDKAVDIHLLKQVLKSSHPEVAEEAWKYFLEGYKEYKDSGEVLNQLEEVEQRGRYK